MNKNRLFGGIYAVLGVLLSIFPQTLFPVCPTTEKVMKCHYSAQAVIVIGVLVFLNGLLSILFSKNGACSVQSSVMTAGCAISGIVIPMTLIGGCGNQTMLCRTTGFPVIYLISAFLILISVVHAILNAKNLRELKI